MKKCERCGDFHSLPGVCVCEPFTIIDEDGDEHIVHAFDEYSAALKYAAESNECNDYYLMNESVEISVNGSQYRISAEPDVHYSASSL